MTDNAIHLRRIEPHRRMWRYYALGLQPTLFGGVDVVRRWGRLGTQGGGQVLVESFANQDAARIALQTWTAKKRRRGYV